MHDDMSSARRLQQLFSVAILAALGADLGACSSSSGTTELQTKLDLDVCTGGRWLPVRGLHPAKPVDYVSLRQTTGAPFSAGSAPKDVVIDETGEMCATASDKAACTDAMSRLHSDGGWSSGRGEVPFANYVATTAKDDRVVYASVPDLLKFLGPIDTANEAALVATTQGHGIVCGQPNARAVDGGFEVLTTTGSGCGPNDDVKNNVVQVSKDGKLTVVESVVIRKGDPNCAIGRRPEGLARVAGRDDAGDFLARIARLEAASVPAFGRLVRELRAHRAPKALIERARRGRRDEVRHARVMTRLARKYRAKTPRAEALALPVRSLVDVAIDNMVEGCVRETFGALVATFQAQHATDRDIAAAMRKIARDETAHAALSWELARWAHARLAPEERARVEAARLRAITELRSELAEEPPREIIDRAGFPTAREAEVLLTVLLSG